jgi:hypothetical protein
MACKATGKRFCVWIKRTPEGQIKGWWRCYDCGRRRRARK